jgi:glycerophosphoryl diester phosphodiesterase
MSDNEQRNLNPRFATSNRKRCREYFAHFALRLLTNPADEDAAAFMHWAWWRMGNRRGLAEMEKMAAGVGVDYHKMMEQRRQLHGGLVASRPADRCHCGAALPSVHASETPYEFCSEDCAN